MLNLLRKQATTWVGIPILVVAVGAMVFTLFQPSGPLVQQQARGTVLATVGKTALADSEYTPALQRMLDRERQTNPGLDMQTFLAGGGGRAVLEQLIRGKALDSYAAANGVTVSRRMVDGEIASVPAFQLNGKFDEDSFRRILSEQRISESELRASVVTDLVQRQLLQPLLAATSVPQSMVDAYAKLMLEQRKGSILPVPSAAMPAPPEPSADVVKAYYDTNIGRYTVPERRSFRYALLDPAVFAAKAAPTDSDVRAYYDSHPGEFGGLETRDAFQIVLSDEGKAKAFAERVRGGADFVAAAKAEGFDRADVFLGRESEEALTATLGADGAKALFALPANGVSAPLKTSFGWQVLHVGAIVPARAEPFQSAAAGIRSRLAEEKTSSLLSDAVAHAEDSLEGGQSLADVARDLGVALQDAPALTRDGRLFDSDYIATRVDLPLLPQVFEADPADGAQVVTYGDGKYALLEVTDVLRPAPAPLDKISPAVVAAWKAKQQSDAAKKLADELAAAASSGKALGTAAAGHALPPVQSLTVRRLELSQMVQQGQAIPPPVLTMLGTPQGQARVVGGAGDQGWYVVKVDDIVPGDGQEAGTLSPSVRTGLERDVANEQADRFIAAIEAEVKVVRVPAAIDEVERRLVSPLGE